MALARLDSDRNGRSGDVVRGGPLQPSEERFQAAESACKKAMQMRICMNYAPAKVIYIIGGWGSCCVCVCMCVRAHVRVYACVRGGVEGIPPSNTDMKQHFPSLIINTKQTTCARTHTVKLPGKLIIHPMNNDTLTQ